MLGNGIWGTSFHRGIIWLHLEQQKKKGWKNRGECLTVLSSARRGHPACGKNESEPFTPFSNSSEISSFGSKEKYHKQFFLNLGDV